jgi:hypothetical protein
MALFICIDGIKSEGMQRKDSTIGVVIGKGLELKRYHCRSRRRENPMFIVAQAMLFKTEKFSFINIILCAAYCHVRQLGFQYDIKLSVY